MLKKLLNRFRRKKEPVRQVMPTDNTKLEFRRIDGTSDYKVYFFNGFVKQWWAIPHIGAAIHAKWGFKKKGSYGAYDLYTYQCSKDKIDYVTNEFRTYQDIKNHFDRMNKNYNSYQDRVKEYSELPQIISM